MRRHCFSAFSDKTVARLNTNKMSKAEMTVHRRGKDTGC